MVQKQQLSSDKSDLVSVIIPVYNTEKYLAQCLESLIYQTYKNLEIIAVNDGSIDNSGKILQEYASRDSRIKIIEQQNSGVSVARNAGMAVAQGKWIHFVDSDDYLNLDYYENMLAAARGTDADVIAGGMVSQNASHFDMAHNTRTLLVTQIEKFKITRALDVAVAVRYLFSRKLLQDINARFEVGRLFEDMLFTPHVIAASRQIVTAPNTWYYYVCNETSILNRRWSKKQKQDFAYALARRQEFAKQHGLRVPSRVTVRKYKLLGIPFMVRKSRPEESKYYICGICVLKTSRVRR